MGSRLASQGLRRLVTGAIRRLVAPHPGPVTAQVLVLDLAAAEVTSTLPLEMAPIGAEEAAAAGIGGDDWAERWRRGDKCYAARVDGAVAGWVWVSRRLTYVKELGRWFRPGRREAYVYDGFTIVEHRGEGILPAILSRIAADLARKGAARIWTFVESDNRASLRACRRAGYRPAGRIRYRPGRRGTWKCRRLPGAPRFAELEDHGTSR